MVMRHDLRVGQVYGCEGCALEPQIVSECEEYGTGPESCECLPFRFVCCGESLKLEED